MADLNELEAAQTVKIAGTNSSGAETNYINGTANNELLTANISNNGGLQGALTVSTTAVEAKVGASALTNRKTLTVFNNSGATLYWGYTSGVTTSSGTPFYEKQFVSFDVGTGTSVYLIAGAGSNNVRVTESA